MDFLSTVFSLGSHTCFLFSSSPTILFFIYVNIQNLPYYDYVNIIHHQNNSTPNSSQCVHSISFIFFLGDIPQKSSFFSNLGYSLHYHAYEIVFRDFYHQPWESKCSPLPTTTVLDNTWYDSFQALKNEHHRRRDTPEESTMLPHDCCTHQPGGGLSELSRKMLKFRSLKWLESVWQGFWGMNASQRSAPRSLHGDSLWVLSLRLGCTGKRRKSMRLNRDQLQAESKTVTADSTRFWETFTHQPRQWRDVLEKFGTELRFRKGQNVRVSSTLYSMGYFLNMSSKPK